MKNKTALIFGGLIVGIIILMWWARTASTPGADTAIATWGNTSVQCLRFGHQSLAFHFHPTLAIFVDGEREGVPTNIGVTQACMAETHTHDATGALHFEAFQADRVLTLENFFAVWNRPIEREGYVLQTTINGALADDIFTRGLKEGDAIVLSYTSVSGTETANISTEIEEGVALEEVTTE